VRGEEVLKFIKKVSRVIAKVETALLILSLAAILLIGIVQIVLRKMGSGITWADEFMRHFTLWLGFIGASLATREKKHITIDVFNRLFTGQKRNYIDAATQFIAAVVCACLCYAAILSVKLTMVDSLKLPSGIPRAVWEMLIPIAFGLMSFRFLVNAIEFMLDKGERKEEEGKLS